MLPAALLEGERTSGAIQYKIFRQAPKGTRRREAGHIPCQSHRPLSPGEAHVSDKRIQSLTSDEFFYFFLQLRKGEIRRTVQALKRRYPRDTPGQLAGRVVEAKTGLALLGGTLLNLPLLVPGVGPAMKLFGLVGATSMLTRMHLYLILEIALVYGQDIDDEARVGEMLAVIAATALGSAAPRMLMQALELNPLYAIPAGALSASAVTQLIGHAAVAFYQEKLPREPEGELAPVPAGSVAS
jgi:uncharacterized protein (DUF697 family)